MQKKKKKFEAQRCLYIESQLGKSFQQPFCFVSVFIFIFFVSTTFILFETVNVSVSSLQSFAGEN